MTDDNPESLRERTRRAVRQQLADSAMRLFVEQGFEATTIDQIAADTGISRRSFFRYFASKEDVVLGELFDRGGIVATALAGRPPGESPWDAVKAALLELQRVTRASDESELQLGRMLYDTPTLRARHLEKQLAWQDLLVPILSERIRSTGRATGIDPPTRGRCHRGRCPRMSRRGGGELGPSGRRDRTRAAVRRRRCRHPKLRTGQGPWIEVLLLPERGRRPSGGFRRSSSTEYDLRDPAAGA
ncbi:TetR/AcrR family transcriptional regulator [Arthrobacter castelli]|uniref:TetR/AcrR family transcriptional regulator n=1 Tax=Arthrobacter castelli TaxID=271431 RepID=UPI00146FA3DB|nr:TetR/AcrR family transcriptional regulator [Arthrobacter castelli]